MELKFQDEERVFQTFLKQTNKTISLEIYRKNRELEHNEERGEWLKV